MAGIFLKSLILNHFRSYKKETLTFSSNGTVFTGANGSGKTNILEAISLFSPGRGLRKSKNYENSRKPENYGWKIQGTFEGLEEVFEIEVSFQESGDKKTSLDGKKTTQSKMNDLVKILWITPQMDRLWTSGALERRNFIDRIAYGFYPNHGKFLLYYEKLVRERNELFRLGNYEKSWMDSLEVQIVNYGIEIFRNRSDTVKILNKSAKVQVNFPKPKLEILGENFINKDTYLMKLRDNRNLDIFSGRTSVGPHKSDLNLIYIDKGIDAKDCSTGEQKALLVSIILSMSREIVKLFGVPPVLLLDEIGAHLDHERRNELILQLFALKAQFFITATDQSFFKYDYDDLNYVQILNKGGNSYIK